MRRTFRLKKKESPIHCLFNSGKKCIAIPKQCFCFLAGRPGFNLQVLLKYEHLWVSELKKAAPALAYATRSVRVPRGGLLLFESGSQLVRLSAGHLAPGLGLPVWARVRGRCCPTPQDFQLPRSPPPPKLQFPLTHLPMTLHIVSHPPVLTCRRSHAAKKQSLPSLQSHSCLSVVSATSIAWFVARITI